MQYQTKRILQSLALTCIFVTNAIAGAGALDYGTPLAPEVPTSAEVKSVETPCTSTETVAKAVETPCTLTETVAKAVETPCTSTVTESSSTHCTSETPSPLPASSSSTPCSTSASPVTEAAVLSSSTPCSTTPEPTTAPVVASYETPSSTPCSTSAAPVTEAAVVSPTPELPFCDEVDTMSYSPVPVTDYGSASDAPQSTTTVSSEAATAPTDVPASDGAAPLSGSAPSNGTDIVTPQNGTETSPQSFDTNAFGTPSLIPDDEATTEPAKAALSDPTETAAASASDPFATPVGIPEDEASGADFGTDGSSSVAGEQQQETPAAGGGPLPDLGQSIAGLSEESSALGLFQAAGWASTVGAVIAAVLM